MSVLSAMLTSGVGVASTSFADAAIWVVFFALQWLLACLLSALLYGGLVRFVFQRRNHRAAIDQGTLFVACFLVALGAANIFIEAHAFTAQAPLFSLLIQTLFLLFFYFYADKRYSPPWARWLGVIYAFSLLSTFFAKGDTNNPIATLLNHVPGLMGAIIVFGNTFGLFPIVLGIVPQVYYRYRQLALTGEGRNMSYKLRRTLGIGVAIVSVVLLLVAAIFERTANSHNRWGYLLAHTVFFLIAGLLPPTAAYAMLRKRRLDRTGLTNRALVYGAMTATLAGIYLLAIAALELFLPGFVQFSNFADFPFVTLIALGMAAAFRPLLGWLQAQVNQRFYRRAYAATQTLAPFAATLYENPQLGTLSAQLVTVVQKALAPDATLLWLRASSISRGVGMSSDRRSDQRVEAARPVELRLFQQVGLAPGSPPPASLTLTTSDPLWLAMLRPSSVLSVQRAPGASLAARSLMEQALALAFPLVSHGELIGLLALGPEADGRPCTVDERELLTGLADQVAPVLRSALLAHEQDVEQRDRERLEQELQTARRIQEALLPKATPILSGWQLATCYQPAREVGGDFYDFIPLPDGQLGIVLGDVTDKGMPAALVMATTRTMIRTIAAQRSPGPGATLAQVNDLLHTDIPAGMFVTCFYAMLDPVSGQARFANAGQDLPILRRHDGSLDELRATGMPLGLLPAMQYDEGTATLTVGDSLLFYSDGVVEAHNTQREMFELPRLQRLIADQSGGAPLIAALLAALATFTGPNWEQEDDVTLVTLQRLALANTEDAGEGGRDPMKPKISLTPADDEADDATTTTSMTTSITTSTTTNMTTSGNAPNDTAGPMAWRRLDEWALPSAPGNERLAIARVAEVVGALDLAPERLEALKTAVGEATMNAMEHGNNYSPNLPVTIEVVASQTALAVRITDEGGSDVIPQAAMPDLDAKLAGLDTPRGWGLYLIKSFVDEVRVTGDGVHHTVELILALDRAE